eukprot:3937925-Rhodomonas_salina.1
MGIRRGHLLSDRIPYQPLLFLGLVAGPEATAGRACSSCQRDYRLCFPFPIQAQAHSEGIGEPDWEEGVRGAATVRALRLRLRACRRHGAFDH